MVTREIAQEVRRELEGIYGRRIQGLTLYGSHARGDATPGSDIDLAVILDDFSSTGEEIGRCVPLIADLSLKHCCVISLLPIRSRDWRQRQTPLLMNIRREGVSLA